MKLLLSSLLLASLCVISSWSVSSTLVTQSHDVSVMEGETVTITCCGTLDRVFERGRLYWLKNQTKIETKIFNFMNRSKEDSLQNKTYHCSNLTFTNVTREDSGRYICMVIVEIPLLTMVEGYGTIITVTARDKTTDNTAGASSRLPFPVIICLAVVAPLLLITLLCFYSLRRRRAQAARVIYEVPHIDSEEVEMDKHSTSSSRGSSQWCQVQVYESVDYFERVQTKESE
ncbi:tyrosine-protein phosphatase non-receptor type substrate 1-like isoform X1 [Sebastes umbrosus]|uniref:tyrosine-protein phosphatase non-receptor type substrate 1-like isoform X1 n=1 Tax=Sebastes umbrosus TaxID=72105 RepID=UPI00189D52C3|nr:tyrosine-protein phosphatase non-receptor type substrate 1-like isoform X1 [Sebastes umbrosus]